ncbi:MULTISPECIES: TonB-dependent receptor [Tenacibaculum]|uniref:TonB-dependent receptor n=1 Tax=Tenacibaculum TaxID=104267 RepID=UPI001F0AC8D1|nr:MULTISPECIES: TonB-dependent receptor plug domain-containing protein [Tenacibaculum]MCH3881195.1 TonB-dependent receptor [Tenacibaculum aquimarinum]MCH3883943.1 TonB-dependent receptor [Tenacibaculum aquimarinum]MDO6599211.1 TonB-dependent receptor [Tenacibaculum sp. 1_MG-2023]
MRNFKNLLLIAMFFTSALVLGQTKITGIVVDETGEPLPGAGVLEQGTTNGTATDFDGKFILNTKSNSGTVVVSFVNYANKLVSFSSANTDLGRIQLATDGDILDEIVITATSFAIDRKTPVAISTLKAADIERKLGSQEFPEVLKSTPGVYATKSGGGFGDSRINLRGFNSENVAVLINGVPVNDMENGRVYWSNWAGLSDVTSAMQVQRGLGASKVAVPSIGGTINILSKTTDVEKGGNIIMSTGNDGYQKYGMTLSTGLMDNGLAATVSASKTTGEGYVDGTEFDGYNYFVNVSKKFNDSHKLSFTTFGAPQRHGQRQNRSTIATYRNAEQGIKFNPDWGYKNGQVTHIEDNFYHKSQTSLNHYWTINDRSNLSTALYVSFGNGGGGGTAGTNRDLFKNRIGGDDQPVDLDAIVEINRNNGALGSEAYLRASRNDHEWYGILSTYKNDVTDELALVAGIDLREYTGIHFSEVTDLLGGQYALDDADVNNPNRTLKVGDKRDYYNDGNVGWQGFFAQLELEKENVSAFLSASLSNTSYQRVDYFNYLDSDPLQTTDTYNFLGFGTKGGANFRLNENHNIFANVGYFEKAAGFDAVFQNFDNENINPDAENQKIFSVELGYGFRSEKFAANINIYRTQWKDRTFTDFYTDRLAGSPTFGQDFAFNLQGVNALHQGVEVDFNYKATDKLTITGMASIGDWNWTDNVLDVPVFNDAQERIATIDLYIKDLKVGDAAQTTAALGLDYKFWEKTSVTVDYNYYGNLYSDYDPNDRTDSTKEGVQPWKVPNYSLFDASLRHGFQIGGLDTTITARMNNVFNTDYISDALDGTSQTALVWYGFGRTFNLSAKIKF